MSIGTERKAFAGGNESTARPLIVTDEHLTFLDDLRESGETNMFGAAPYIEKEFPNLSRENCREILGYWMKMFGKPNR